ncbi:Vesicle trafficking between the ER and Golgi [Coemansia erecta]|uniref:Vesicle trafficking between the ER and Golgi n=1 Tax=Coemansia erecta TaxID=147472 RepID=A0A9W7XU55_9FUNG|nr:Vesicle trafficking between the ER and Golgi [Coemansia erecta]
MIKEWQLDMLFQMEEQIRRQSKSSIIKAINDPENTDMQDKMRLYILYMLANEGLKQVDRDKCEAALWAAGCDLAALEYINKLRSLNKMNSSIASPSVGSGTAAGRDLLGKFLSISNRLAGLTDSSSLAGILSGVRNLLPSNKQLPVSRIVEAVMNGRASGLGGSGGGLGIGINIRSGASGSSSSGGGGVAAAKLIENYVHFNLKQARRRNLAGSNAASDISGPSQDAIVFIVGGGNYIEYQNLMEFAQHETPCKNIV